MCPVPGGTVDNGYGAEHRAAREEARPIVEAGLAYCWRCGGWMDPSEPWDIGHDAKRVIRGPEHVKCNRGAAARLGQERRKAEREPPQGGSAIQW